jgi:protein-disulfide isomerase
LRSSLSITAIEKGGIMKRFTYVFLLVAVATAFYGCSKPCAQSNPDKGIAAIVNNETITMDELSNAAKDRLARVDTEIYQVKKAVLDNMIEEKLIAAAAKKKAMGVEKYMLEEIDAKAVEPTEEEIKALFDASKGAITKPFDEVKGQIAEYLKQNRKAQAKAELLAKLKENTQVEIKLSPPRIDIDVGNAPAIGDKDAKVTLVEFSDYQCPFCKRARPTVWRITDEYKGKIRYVFLDFPLPFHRESKKAHEAAHCAGDQGTYFEYNRKLFDNQPQFKSEDLKKYAMQLNLNMNEFNKCLDTGKYAEDVEKTIEKGMKAGVSGTPAFFINGIMLTGAMPYESFKEIIDTELKR